MKRIFLATMVAGSDKDFPAQSYSLLVDGGQKIVCFKKGQTRQVSEAQSEYLKKKISKVLRGAPMFTIEVTDEPSTEEREARLAARDEANAAAEADAAEAKAKKAKVRAARAKKAAAAKAQKAADAKDKAKVEDEAKPKKPAVAEPVTASSEKPSDK